MRIKWLNSFYEKPLVVDKPRTWFVMGVRGAGKSSFLEAIAERALEKGSVVLDLFGSRDGEGLAWLRSKHVWGRHVLLVHGDTVNVTWRTAPADTKHYKELDLKDFERYDLIISASPLYSLSGAGEEYEAANYIIKLLYERLAWRRHLFVIVREAANLFYSRFKVHKNQFAAKSELIYFLREMRHFGVSMALDTQKFTSVDIDVRSLVDYHVIKAMGFMRLPDDLAWLYGYVGWQGIARMPPNIFIIVTKDGWVGVGEFQMPPWHKKPHECMVLEEGQQPPKDSCKPVVKIVRHRDEEERMEVVQPVRTRAGKDSLHVELVSLYANGLSGRDIEMETGATYNQVMYHVYRHNKLVQLHGRCPICAGAGSPVADLQLDTSRKRYIAAAAREIEESQ